MTTGLVVDSSAVLAILQAEPGSEELIGYLAEPGPKLMSAAIRVELGIVTEARYGVPGRDLVERFVRDADISLAAVDADQAERALSAWRRYGKGRHRASLNFGDCFSYALADRTGLALLCTGADFAATDLVIAGSESG